MNWELGTKIRPVKYHRCEQASKSRTINFAKKESTATLYSLERDFQISKHQLLSREKIRISAR